MKKLQKFIIFMTTTVLLKRVKVKTSVFTLIADAADVCTYIEDCVRTGSAYVMYADPTITTAFYSLGTTAAGNITTAIATYTSAPTDANRNSVADKKAEGIQWLESYSEKVEDIANLDANRATREAAYTNITHSFLTPYKLSNSTKGVPETPVLTGTITGANTMLIEITNGITYIPSQTCFIVVQLPAFTTTETPDPVVVLRTGQLTVNGATGEMITKTLSGKGKTVKIVFTNTGRRYAVYAYAKNGNKLVSTLSEVIIVNA
ncbi:MAG: hypothetical protein WCG32_02750 [Actinomycetes bacterium]